MQGGVLFPHLHPSLSLSLFYSHGQPKSDNTALPFFRSIGMGVASCCKSMSLKVELVSPFEVVKVAVCAMTGVQNM